MKTSKIILSAILLGTAGIAAAATTHSYSTTITSLSFELPEAPASNSYPPPESPAKPRSIILTPALPDNCLSFPLSNLFQLNDLTNDAQKQLYATLVSAKLNGLTVNLMYQIEGSNMRCRVVGVSF